MFKKALVAVAAVAIVVAASLVAARRPKHYELDGYTFEKYVKDFNKHYKAGTPEYKMRKHEFLRQLAWMRKHNADASQSWKAGVNGYTDMTVKEWKKFNAFKKSPLRPAPTKFYTGLESSAAPPAEVDLRRNTEPRIVSEVKHQGSCGCCWANSGTESMESYYALATGALPVLSYQQFASCTPQPMSYGCDGGDYAMGWMAINQTAGYALTEEWCYGFTDFFFPTSGNPPTAACYNITSKFPNKHPYSWFADLVQVGISGYVSVTPNNATAMQKALAEVGPQSISVAAGCHWQHYESGVFVPPSDCSEDEKWSIDHAVQCVGYGRDKALGKDYWIVRNSWSTLWGDNGYIYLYRASNPAQEPCAPVQYGVECGTSGVLSDPQYPLVTPYPGLPW